MIRMKFTGRWFPPTYLKLLIRKGEIRIELMLLDLIILWDKGMLFFFLGTGFLGLFLAAFRLIRTRPKPHPNHGQSYL